MARRISGPTSVNNYTSELYTAEGFDRVDNLEWEATPTRLASVISASGGTAEVEFRMPSGSSPSRTIRITASNKDGESATLDVVCKYTPPPQPPEPEFNVQQIEIDGPSGSWVSGREVRFTAITYPDQGVPVDWEYSSSNLSSPSSGTLKDSLELVLTPKVSGSLGTLSVRAKYADVKSDLISLEIFIPNPRIEGPTAVTNLSTEWYHSDGFSSPAYVSLGVDSPNATIISTGESPKSIEVEFSRNATYPVKIIAKSEDGSGERAELNVTCYRTVQYLSYFSTGEVYVYTGETVTKAVFRMVPNDPEESQTNFAVSYGASACRAEFVSSNVESGVVYYKITGVNEGTDTIHVSNGLISGDFKVIVQKKPEVSSITIEGPDRAYSSGSTVDPGVVYSATTVPIAGTPVYWDAVDLVNLNDGMGGSTTVRRTECDFHPWLKEGFSEGQFTVIAYYNTPDDTTLAQKIVKVKTADIDTIDITGPDEIENLVKVDYNASITVSGGNPQNLKKKWIIEGDAKITYDTGNFVYVVGDIGDKTEGSAKITLWVENYSTWKEIKIIPSIREMSVRGPRFLDKGSSAKAQVFIEPSNARNLPVKWIANSGQDNVSINYVETALQSHTAEIGALKPGLSSIRVSSLSGQVYAGFNVTIKGKVYGSTDSPLSKLDGSLLTYIGDSIYLGVPSPVDLKPVSDSAIDCHAVAITNGFGLGMSLSGGIEGTVNKPGIIEIASEFKDTNSLDVTSHTTTIYAVARSGVDRIDIKGPSEVSIGHTVEWVATVNPPDAEYPAVSFETSSPEIRIVDQTYNPALGRSVCTIEGISKGIADIIARSADLRVEVKKSLRVSAAVPPRPPVAQDDNVCCLDIYNKGGSPVRIMMPHVQSISDSDNVTLSEISTVMFGFRNRFIMDMGTSKTYSISFVRSNPPFYNDNSHDPQEWSNGKWYSYLVASLDFWQNFGLTANNDYTAYEMTGGFKLHFIPGIEFADLYPEIHHTVFLIGGMGPSINLGKLSFKMTFQVARMMGKSQDIQTVRLMYNSNSEFVSESYLEKVPMAVPVPISNPPQSWVEGNRGFGFKYWTESEMDVGRRFYPGSLATWSKDSMLHAQWMRPLGIRVFEVDSEFTISDDRVSSIIIYAVGGGGGSGCGKRTVEQGGGPTFEYSGGAGGGGELIDGKEIGVMFNDSFTIHIGTGGAGGEISGFSKNDGKDGDDTVITPVKSSTLDRELIARGGTGGRGYRVMGVSETPGGAQYYAGGNGPLGVTDGNPGQLTGFGGTGGARFREGTGVSTYESAGGSGGGCSNLIIQSITLDDGTRTPYIRAKGGDGGYRTAKDTLIPGESGRYGGGAGSTPGQNGAKGSDGLVVIILK